jgi:hypothetical protein
MKLIAAPLIAVACAASAQGGIEALRERCTAYGFSLGTPSHAACVERLDARSSGATDENALRDQCWAAMLGRRSGNGSSDAFQNAQQCNSNPRAHLEPQAKPLNCTLSRDVFGRISGSTCQ